MGGDTHVAGDQLAKASFLAVTQLPYPITAHTSVERRKNLVIGSIVRQCDA